MVKLKSSHIIDRNSIILQKYVPGYAYSPAATGAENRTPKTTIPSADSNPSTVKSTITVATTIRQVSGQVCGWWMKEEIRDNMTIPAYGVLNIANSLDRGITRILRLRRQISEGHILYAKHAIAWGSGLQLPCANSDGFCQLLA